MLLRARRCPNGCIKGVLSSVLYLALVLCYSHAFQTRVHPDCNLSHAAPIFERVQDITRLLHGQTIPPDVCIFNPSVIRYQDDLLLWAARAYVVRGKQFGCLDNYETPLPPLTYDGWKGNNMLVLAMTRTSLSPRGILQHELVGHTKIDIPLEDPRLFKDADGAIWVMMHFPKGGCMTATFVMISCGRQPAAAGTEECQLGLGGTRILWYLKQMKIEKNWVPHNGTFKMSYPRFPTFGPHSVFDWGSYLQPQAKNDFDSIAPEEPFFSDIQKTYHGLLEFAGSTPAVRHGDGQSYVAVGHLRAHALCFHNLTSGHVSATCAELAAKSERHGLRFFQYEHRDGRSYSHHYKEYAMFFYRFNATPPYNITHMSYAFLPCSVHHSGITFPAGLERIGPSNDFLIAYGEANRYSRILTISAMKFDQLLLPMDEMRKAVSTYSLCTMPCAL